MRINVINYTILTSYSAPYSTWVAGLVISVFFDTDTYVYDVELDGNPVTAGPFLFSLGGSVSPSPQPYYQWCDGTTLRKVSAYTSFPYATTLDYAGSSECAIDIVCDLLITGVVITDSTTLISNDGSFVASATTSNGQYVDDEIRFGLRTGDTVTWVNFNGIFTGLAPGNYILVVEDAALCRQERNVYVGYGVIYADKYIGEYDDANGNQTKLVIQEIDYFGESSEMCFGDTPIVLTYQECDKYTPLVASNLEAQLLAESYGDFQDLFSQDDRKFKVLYYKDFGSGYELYWVGYIMSQFYSQSFVRGTNNYVSITCTDQIGVLKDNLFRDQSGNKYQTVESQLFIIREILKKTGLELNIRVQDNIFDEGMDDTSDPLSQAFVDTRIFEELKNDEVLSHVIKPKAGLRLFQALGCWYLVRSSDNVGTFDYIEYDFELTEVDTGTYNPAIQRILPSSTGGVCWIDASQFLEMMPMYGYAGLTQTLGFDDNFIDEGRFEEEDLIVDGSGNLMFKNWGVTNRQPGMVYGIEYIDNGESKGAFFADLRNASQQNGDNILKCIEIPCETGDGGVGNKFKVAFEYSIYPVWDMPWVKISWMLRLTTPSQVYALRKHGYGSYVWLEDEYYNDIYVTTFGSLQNFEILAPGFQDGTISLHLAFHNQWGRDYDSIADMKVYNPAGQEDLPGKRFVINDSGFTYFYELTYSEEAESLPDIVRPNSYTVFDKLLWRLVSTVAAGQYTSLVNKILFDNVKISYVPVDVATARNFAPPETVTYPRVLNERIKQNYTDDFLLGDIPPISNSKTLYRGYLRLEDGTPTGLWNRKGVTEVEKLFNIYLNDLESQLNYLQKITANLKAVGTYYTFLNCLNYDSKRWLNGYYSLNDKRCELNLQLIETITGATGEPPVILGEFATLEFDNSFDNGE